MLPPRVCTWYLGSVHYLSALADAKVVWGVLENFDKRKGFLKKKIVKKGVGVFGNSNASVKV